MAQPTLLAIAKADLKTAGNLVKLDNKFQKHQAAYFVQQSIEKTLKYLISRNVEYQPWGHDIRKLVIQSKQLGIDVPKRIEDRADVYTSWEAITRYYPTKVIYRNTIEDAIKVTQEWHKVLRKQGIR